MAWEETRFNGSLIDEKPLYGEFGILGYEWGIGRVLISAGAGASFDGETILPALDLAVGVSIF